MINGKRVIAVIPARGGSKGIIGKNITDLGGKPLIAWPIEQAIACDYIDRVIVSTDDTDIKKSALAYQAEVYDRADELATDTALVTDTLRDLYNRLKDQNENCDIIVLLQCTSPFREEALLEKIIESLEENGYDSVATFKEIDEPIERMWDVSGPIPKPYIDGANPWLPRQALTTVHALDGVVYAYRPSLLPNDSQGILFGNFGAVINNSSLSIDIDTPQDLAIARAMLLLEHD